MSDEEAEQGAGADALIRARFLTRRVRSSHLRRAYGGQAWPCQSEKDGSPARRAWLSFDVGQKTPAPVSNPPIEEEVVAFVADCTRYAAAKITPQTTLFGDIGIDGDDGPEILAAFMERFQVDMSACRPVHFGGEGFVPWAPLLWIRKAWLARSQKDSTPESRAGLVPITVRDLVESARARRWVLRYEEEANQSNGDRR